MTEDFYHRTAEYVAVLLRQAWTGLGPALAKALSDVDTSDGPVVDVGAGTGIGTAVLAAALPGADIIAIEPNPALRTALLTRCVEDDDLARRVTVLGTDALAAPLPDRLSVVLAMNVLGHFGPGERRALWKLLADRLSPGGRAILNLQPPTTAVAVPSTPMAQVRIGDREYLGVAAAEPAGPDAITWTMTYRVEQGGSVVTELTASDLWQVITASALADEVAEYGLRLTVADPEHDLYTITRT
ncbi:class I SAM-dependent methyltransferase [Amycolatopsis sp. NPDC057786]|uniref:class I SAM-dependent methyltransferase n=1 Tax=Amycolatopsis sp. NPDC057786 TaxID=3346250 RepID=UPI00367084D8